MRILKEALSGVAMDSCRLRNDPQPASFYSLFCSALRFQWMEDHSDTPINAAPPRPVMTSGILTKDCRNMINESMMMA